MKRLFKSIFTSVAVVSFICFAAFVMSSLIMYSCGKSKEKSKKEEIIEILDNADRNEKFYADRIEGLQESIVYYRKAIDTLSFFVGSVQNPALSNHLTDIIAPLQLSIEEQNKKLFNLRKEMYKYRYAQKKYGDQIENMREDGSVEVELKDSLIQTYRN